MGCFFGCFRIKDSNANLVAPSKPVAPRSKNALSSLFQCDDESLRRGKEGQKQLPGEVDVRELKNEAKFLKACGTTPKTPVETRKASEKWEGISAPYGAENCSKCNSWLLNASLENLKVEKHSDESQVPVKICEKCLLDSPSSCLTDGHNTKRASGSSIQRSDVENFVTPMVMCGSETHSETSSVSTLQCKNKSVHLHYASDRSAISSKGSSSECVSPYSKQSGSAGMQSVIKPSPYPTPLRLTEEMQTAGTVFPAYRNNMTGGQVSEVSCQYVNSVIDPIESPRQSKELKDENSGSNHPRESLELNDDQDLSMSTPVSDLSVREEMNNEASLSSWFKPVSANQDGNNKRYWRKTPGDRPILGMVAAHWNDDETSHISPKWWDGNGIPNSTNKYKEDQKVSWHATPFEERLEKALSEESLISQRKPINTTPPFELNETEESDTALSHMQSSAHLKSVVSF